MEYKNVITIEAGKRGGKPCIRGLRITVYDVLDCLANGMNPHGEYRTQRLVLAPWDKLERRELH